MSVPTDRVEVINVAVVTPFVVLRVPVPSVIPPLVKVTVPVGGAEAPVTAGMVKVNVTGEPKMDVVGFAVSVSPEPGATPTVSVVEEEMGPKLPAAGAVAVIGSVPTGSAVVVMEAIQDAGVPVGVDGKLAVPSVEPLLVKVTTAVGQVPLIGVTDSVSVTTAP